ncbi:MAG TPA: hypothetical protein GX729_07165, partial [Firmicutes bacterium]|nr:hypothetical protein [Bacillota bacterium]
LTSDAVDFLMSQKNGANYVVLYQMLCLKTVNTGGELSRQIGEVIIPFDVDKIQRDCKYFEKDTVVVALELYQKLGLVYENKDGFLQIANFDNLVGSETRQAGLMREKRKRINEIEQTANQNKTFYIDNYTNKKRYGGNYYYVLERDKKRCASCGSTENLCVHHIIGYDENEPKSCNASSMITLCRTCHSNEHNNPHSVVTNKLLDDISFDMELYSLISTINPNSRGNKVTRELQKSYSKVTQDIDIRDKILDTRYKSIDIDSIDVNKSAHGRTRKEIINYIKERCDIELQEVICSRCYGNTEVLELVIDTIADILSSGESLSIKNNKINSEALYELVRGINNKQLSSIIQGFYQEKDGKWVRKQVSVPAKYIFTVLFNQADTRKRS